ncbi:MAG: aminopeptidase [Cyclobacteriaceae bacterium]
MMWKKITAALLFIITVLLIWQLELVAYGLGQARGQFNIIWHSRDIEEVLNDPEVADSLKQKILLTQEIREFAIDSLGVNDSNSYRSLYDQKGKPVLWVVTACEPFSMKDRKWKFPVIGTFSYKGFFDYEKALAEKARLDAEGLDTGIRTVSAWSTLGIFDDPILSELLFRSEGSLANTIIHELTHATLFVKDDLKFNENLASFVGNKGAESFLIHKYGENSAEHQSYINYLHDRRLFAEHMLQGTRRLDSLYRSFTEDLSPEQKSAQKLAMILSILEEAKNLEFRTENYRLLPRKMLKEELPNNTFFKGYVRYQSELNSLEKEYSEQFDSDLKKYLSYLKAKYEK